MIIYMGYDPREDLGYRVAKHSFESRSSKPVEVKPLILDNIEVLDRPVEKRGKQLWCPISDAPMSTEFAISRFAVPFLQEGGWAMFIDCDVLCLSDVQELFELRDGKYAVMCVKHKQESGSEKKMDDQIQTFYSKKNWSSMVLWNLDHPANKRFTVEMLNTLPGRDLHAFCWLNEDEIGELPIEWNWLSGVSEEAEPKIIHYTLGTPDMLQGAMNNPGGDLWLEETKHLTVNA